MEICALMVRVAGSCSPRPSAELRHPHAGRIERRHVLPAAARTCCPRRRHAVGTTAECQPAARAHPPGIVAHFRTAAARQDADGSSAPTACIISVAGLDTTDPENI